MRKDSHGFATVESVFSINKVPHFRQPEVGKIIIQIVVYDALNFAGGFKNIEIDKNS